MINSDAIEAGAKAQYEDNTGHKWGSKPEFMAIWRHHAFIVLQAAAPFMRTRRATAESVPSAAEIEELTELIRAPRMSTNMSGDKQRATAEAILTEGYRKVEVPRIVMTEDELDELPLLSIVVNKNESNPCSWQKRTDSKSGRNVWYRSDTADWGWEAYYILEDGEATVLWEPPMT